jgi:hypothetical protein
LPLGQSQAARAVADETRSGFGFGLLGVAFAVIGKAISIAVPDPAMSAPLMSTFLMFSSSPFRYPLSGVSG